VRLVYGGRGTALRTHVTPGNRHWLHAALTAEPRSIERARHLLASAGFSRRPDGLLLDAGGHAVEFSILVAAGNPERVQMATIIQDDLKQLGIKVQVATLEFRSVLDRVLHTRQFDAAVLGLGGGDADPNGYANMLLSSGATHLWRPAQKQPATPWEAETDRLMREQMVTRDPVRRKRLYDRIQELEAENMPLICLASPHALAAAKPGLGNFRPAAMDASALWNADELYWKPVPGGGQ
jgi:peptide/nickel transport system substrate-binding protein